MKIKVLSIADISKMTLNDISKYIDDTFGVVSPDDCMKHDKRYYYDYDIDEATGEKMAIIERVRGFLLRIRYITQELRETPDISNRDRLLKERETLYAEYSEHFGTNVPSVPTSTLLNNKAFMDIIQKAIDNGFVVVENGCYKWEKSKSKLVVFADELYSRSITSPNKWSDVERFFGVKDLSKKWDNTQNLRSINKIRTEISNLF